MSEELMITKEDLVNWLDRPPSNDDLDLIGFITTRLENFYKLEEENKQLKEEIEEYKRIEQEDLKAFNNYDSILTELEEWVKSEYNRYLNDKENLVFSNVEVIDFGRVLDKIQELKEKYK